MLECLMAAWLWPLFNHFFKGFGLSPASLKIFGVNSSHIEVYVSLQAINADIFDSEPIENLLHIFGAAQSALQYVRSGIITFSHHLAEKVFDRESHCFARKLLVDRTP